MRHPATIAQAMALIAASAWFSEPIRFARHPRVGGAPWAARSGRKAWKHARRQRG